MLHRSTRKHWEQVTTKIVIFPQMAIAIGVLTSNRGEADQPLWLPLQGAIVVCYGWGAEGDDQFWWSGRGAIAGCHCSVLWLGGGG